MFAKSRFHNQSSSKKSITQKYPIRSHYPKIRNFTIDEGRYISRPNEDEDYDYRRRNHTDNKNSRHSAVTIKMRSKTGHSNLHYPSYPNSKSQNLNKIRRSFKPNEGLKQEKLLMIRQERLNKLKDGFTLKNRIQPQKKVHPSIHNNSNAKFNSFNDFNSRKLFVQEKKRSNQKQQKNSKQHRDITAPKFFNFCNTNRYKSQVNKQIIIQDSSFTENVLPQLINKNSKAKSMKKITQMPSLAPVTLESGGLPSQINIDWIKGSYRPYLQIFQNISMDNFVIRKIQKGVYFGQIQQATQTLQGKGFIFYHNGKVFEGHFSQGHKEGLGYEYYNDKSSYLGNFSKGKRNGKGRFQWSNGEVYDGQWKNNKKQGSGIWKSKDTSYVGEWHSDTMQGFGVLVQKNTRYEGQFRNFMKCGNGTMRFQNGQTYTGAFKQNLPNGIGDYYWNNGDHYHGEYVNGKRHGQGFVKYSKGGSYRGEFKNDKKSGQGEQTYEDDLFYEGSFQNDLKHGWGALYCDQNAIFQGYWLNNTAVDPTKAIDTIIEEESMYEKDYSRNSQLKKIDSSASMLRNKIMNRKLRINKSNSKDKVQVKPFRRACNCERHRKINEQLP